MKSKKGISMKKCASDIFQRITRLYLILMVTLFLMYTGLQGYAGITEAKYRMFLTICGGYAAVMLLLVAESTVIGRRKVRNFRSIIQAMSWVQRMMMIFVMLTWISALTSSYFPQTIIGASRYEGALTITIYCVCFFLVRTYGRIDKALVWAFAAAVSVFDLICLVQLYGGNPLSLYPAGYGYADAYMAYSGAYLGTIGNVDLVAAFLCLVIPAFWVTMLRGYDRRRFLLTVPLILSVFVLVKMHVLAGFVGVFGGAVIASAVVIPMKKHQRRIAGCILLGVLAAMVIVLYFCDFGGMFHEIHCMLHGEFDDAFGSGRLHIWKSVLQKVPEHLLLGTGPDTMIYGGIEVFTRYDAAVGGTIVAQIDTAHNEYLNVLYHQGVPALLAYLGMLAAAAKKWMAGSAEHPQIAVLGTMLLCYFIQAFFGFSMIMTAPYAYIVLALFDKY